jgi:hypothetical protein
VLATRLSSDLPACGFIRFFRDPRCNACTWKNTNELAVWNDQANSLCGTTRQNSPMARQPFKKPTRSSTGTLGLYDSPHEGR